MNQSTTASIQYVQDMQPLRALVLLEDLQPSQRAAIDSAMGACRVEARLYQKPMDLIRELGTNGAHVVVLSAEAAKVADVCAAVRRLVGRRVVILGIARHVEGVAFGEFAGWGGDDLIEADSKHALCARFRAIRSDLVKAGATRTIPQPREDGRFLVVAPEKSEVAASAPLIEQAGHHAAVVHTLEDAATRLAVGRDVRLVIDSRMPGALGFVDAALAGSSCAGIVLACLPAQLGQLTKRYQESSDRLIVLDCFSPTDAVVLAANQLKAQPSNRRSTERLLFSTLVCFREAGGDVDQVGYTYNVSAGGMYVRTTAMPASEHVWVEIVPPGSIERVRLEGRVAWRTPVTRADNSPFPVGIGIEITEGSKRSLAAWVEGYRALQSKLDVASQRRPVVGSSMTLVRQDAPPVPAELDPACRPTVRPPTARRRREIWSSMSSGPSAAHLAGQAMTLQETPQVAAIHTSSPRRFGKVPAAPVE
jgi:Tfp pilus assembly protein PilZ